MAEEIKLSEVFLARLAGWDAVKEARGLVAAERVLASDWQPPNLNGSVREGSATYRAGLVIRSASDADNLCACRTSRQRGLICAHSVAVGLHFLRKQSPQPPPAPRSVEQPRVTPIAAEAPKIGLATALPECKLHLAGGLAVLQARLEFLYDGKVAQFVPIESRNSAAEQAAVSRLTSAGFVGPDRQGFYHLKGQDVVLNFFARHYRALEKGWAVTLEERLERSTRNLERVEPRFQITLFRRAMV